MKLALVICALSLMSSPRNTTNWLPCPTTSGSTQWAAVSTTCGDTTSPVHNDAEFELGICAISSTTDGSPVSAAPPMIACSELETPAGDALQPASTRTTQARFFIIVWPVSKPYA